MNVSAASRLTADSRVILIGAGGHARSLLGVMHAIGCEVVGLVADDTGNNLELAGHPVLGRLAELRALITTGEKVSLVLAVGDNYHRLRIFYEISKQNPEIRFPPVTHPSAVIAHDVVLGDGTVIMPGAVVMAGSQLGAACLLNTRASLDHECVLEEGAALGPGAVTGGRVAIGRRSFVGLGASVIQGVSIGADTVVGAGALVLKDLPESVLAHGLPARVIRPRNVDEAYL